MKKSLWISLCVILFLTISGFISYKKVIERPHLTVVGRVKMADGIGRQSVEVIEALYKDMSVSFVPTVSPDFKDVPPPIKKIIQKKCRKPGKVILYEDILWMPDHDFFKKMPKNKDSDTVRIAYSMFESDVIPHEWVVILNTRFDAVIVPDKYFIKVYENSGVEIPVFTLPLGLNITKFLKKPIKQSGKSPMVFANFSASDDRKNQILLIRAFAKAFKNNTDVRLVLNSRFKNDEGKRIRNEIRELGLKNVHFSELSLNNEDYLKLFQTVDCYVNLSKGEGFSIQPREAMALGIPTIVTNNSAQGTLCESGLVKAVSSPIEEPAYYNAYKTYHGSYFTCTIEDATEALLDVYNNYEKYLSKAQKAREWAKQYQFSNLQGLYKSLVKPKKILLGKKNEITEDCLMTNSQELYNKYCKIVEGK